MELRTILLVDDDQRSINPLTDLLAIQGHQLVWARTEEQAFAAVATSTPELILLEVRTVRLDNFGVLRRLKEREESANIPVVLIGAQSDAREIEKGLRQGAADVVYRPFRPEELRARLSGHIELAQLRRLTGTSAALKEDLDELEDTAPHQLTSGVHRVATRVPAASLVTDTAASPFLADVLRTVRRRIHSIAGFATVLRKGMSGPLSDEQTAQLEMVLRNAEHALGMTDDALEIARMQAGQLTLTPASIDLRATIQSVAARVEGAAKDKGLTLSVRVPSRAKAIVTDKRRLEQILKHLLVNAIKFTEEGEVSLSCEAVDGWVAIRVTDTGLGIRRENLPHIFEPFQRLDEAESRQNPGSRLGLAVCKGLAEALGGDISVSSAKGIGSTFTVRLPLDRPAAAPRPEAVGGTVLRLAR